MSYRSVPIRANPAVRKKVPETRKTFQWPVRVMICPETVEEIARPRIIGSVIRPATVGVSPRASWKYWLRKVVPPNIATPTSTLATTLRLTVRILNRRSGTMGSLTLDSTRRKSIARTTAPPTIAPVCHDSQSYLLPAKETQISSSETAAVISVAPPQSMRTSRLTVGRCRVFCSTISERTANGTPT
ncbi:hypothetical protein GCM10027612_16390 [Microbispora bryophytorum subsp. camponoti]